jgi:membrane protease YdiL (CAAX protease family)
VTERKRCRSWLTDLFGGPRSELQAARWFGCTIVVMRPDNDDAGGRGFGNLTRRIKTVTGLLSPAIQGETAVVDEISSPPPGDELLPERYQLKEDADGPYLQCVESSNIHVRIERGSSVSASAAKKQAAGTMFLDGAAQGEPFMDAAKGIYNLDHHEGCVRSFTLATCEQAMVLILKGLDLAGQRWTVHANEPDFDTVLAIWLLLNHRRLDADDDLRRRMMPIVRLEGAIDAHGLDLAELTGYPPEMQRETLAAINDLRARELELKKQGSWGDLDFLEFTAGALREIDELVYSPWDFQNLRQVEELAREWITPQKFAIACRSESGIYEVEEHLKEVHGDRLGIIFLATDDATYTVRKADPFLATPLESLYDRLNLLDPLADSDNRWGGSEDIGGSPRATGTGLSLDRIMGICRWVYNPPSIGRRLGAVVGGVALTAAVVVAAVAAGGGGNLGAAAAGRPDAFGTASAVLLGLAAALTLLGRKLLPGYFGLRLPRGAGFLVWLPVAAAAAAAGGAWVPLQLALAGTTLGSIGWRFALALLAGVVGIELLMRGVLHGIIATGFPIMLWSGRRFLSVPNLVSSVAFTAAVMACFRPPWWLGQGSVAITAWAAAALAMGLVCGAVRERIGSVWAAVITHTAAAAAAWAVLSLVFAP